MPPLDGSCVDIKYCVAFAIASSTLSSAREVGSASANPAQTTIAFQPHLRSKFFNDITASSISPRSPDSTSRPGCDTLPRFLRLLRLPFLVTLGALLPSGGGLLLVAFRMRVECRVEGIERPRHPNLFLRRRRPGRREIQFRVWWGTLCRLCILAGLLPI